MEGILIVGEVKRAGYGGEEVGCGVKVEERTDKWVGKGKGWRKE